MTLNHPFGKMLRLVAGLTSNEAFSEFQIRHFVVLDEFSAMIGSPEKALA
jgi:hypothetical protein